MSVLWLNMLCNLMTSLALCEDFFLVVFTHSFQILNMNRKELTNLMEQLKYHEFAFRAAAEREDVMKPPPPIVWSLCPPWPWRWWFEPTMRGWTAARSKWVTCPFSNGIEPLIRSGTIPNPPPGRVSVPVVVSVRVQVVWDRLACCKMKKYWILLHIYSLLCRTWAQTISMASCLISTPGNSANMEWFVRQRFDPTLEANKRV